MLVKEMVAKALEITAELENESYCEIFTGIRFENKDREIGDICEESKANNDREDERDFPEYGTEEYEEMESMGGASAWGMEEMKRAAKMHGEKECRKHFMPTDHCYLVTSKYTAMPELIDDGEIVLVDAEVVYKFW